MPHARRAGTRFAARLRSRDRRDRARVCVLALTRRRRPEVGAGLLREPGRQRGRQPGLVGDDRRRRLRIDQRTGCGPGVTGVRGCSQPTSAVAGRLERDAAVHPARRVDARRRADRRRRCSRTATWQAHRAPPSPTRPNTPTTPRDVFFQCAAGLTPCAGGTNDFSGTLELPGGRGGSLYLCAGCGSGYNTGSCNERGQRRRLVAGAPVLGAAAAREQLGTRPAAASEGRCSPAKRAPASELS